jgi:hypothetical protein
MRAKSVEKLEAENTLGGQSTTEVGGEEGKKRWWWIGALGDWEWILLLSQSVGWMVFFCYKTWVG